MLRRAARHALSALNAQSATATAAAPRAFASGVKGWDAHEHVVEDLYFNKVRWGHPGRGGAGKRGTSWAVFRQLPGPAPLCSAAPPLRRRRRPLDAAIAVSLSVGVVAPIRRVAPAMGMPRCAAPRC